ncbi:MULTISPECIES: hypothetical protein [Nostoc]|uniref:Tetratricopeptide repeat protein n=1 Tax=Nostoc paludosum FACHB-159 TaxID=2692908 RepID=A0ABR8K8K6_9NOSO|nr:MULTISPECIES: hypothetical protein [Nostoc]MBD2679542.1 hypothetical protein [Nostoc sp. FACHB-857]MBD2735800.1 hypothetical protein [Nostoc paludosum FACHB-159]
MLNCCVIGLKITYYFAEESSYKADQALAGVIGNFGVLIAQFPHGNIANNLDIAIACYEVIEIIFNFDNCHKFWGISKMNLGTAYGNRIYGDQIENLEKALLAYQDALKVYSYEEFAIEWAKNQNNRISFYIKKNRITKMKFDYCEILENIVKVCNLVSDIFKKNLLKCQFLSPKP